VKDRSAAGEMVSVGEGTVDFAAIFSEANVQHYFVEYDNLDDPVQSIKTSHRTVDARSQLRAAARCRVPLICARAVKRSDTEYQQRLSLFRS
jgi:sugar phosphate isomerase/epimerase